MKLSQCMIVKNEEKNIRTALSWGKGIVCEQIVVDTGSSDKTVEIAKEMGAKVFYFPWIDDFSAAKNFALEKAMGDWIVFLDADEYFKKEESKKLPMILNKIENMKKGRNPEKCNTITCSIVHLDLNGNVLRIQKQTRLFRNKKYIKYTGRIHEQIEAYQNHSLSVADLSGILSIYHTGYAWTEEMKLEKGKRNITLLKQALDEAPQSASIQLYLAESLSMTGEQLQALSYVCQAVANIDSSLDKERLLTAYQLRLYTIYAGVESIKISKSQVQIYYEEAIAYDAECPDFDIAVGSWYYEKEEFEKARVHLLLALDKANQMKDLTYSRITEFLPDIYKRLTGCGYHNGNWEETVKYGTLALQLDKYETGILLPILNQFIRVNGDAANRVLEYLELLYNFENRKDLYFLLKHTRLAGFYELEEELKNYLSEEELKKIYGFHESR